MLRRWFTLLMIAMLPIMAMAQSGTVYPIDLSVMMTPPYGPCLKEYVGSDRINIQALLKDFTKNSDQFVVELKVTDNRNRMVLLTHFGDYDFPAGKTFTYPMGPNSTSAQKSNVLHDLFNNAKIKPKDECFEEGAYTFVFQAFDAHSYGSRKVALSMPFTYPVFLQGNTVQPLQIYPYEHEVICNHAFEYTAKNGIKKIATQLGGIAYQWQSANPTGMRVGYHVQVVDLGEIAGRTKENIESAAQSSFGITDKYILDRRTYTPFCNHDFTAANYVEDHAYAWRVMAVTGDALDKEASFTDKNAPVRVFYFCGAPGIEKDDYVVVKDERKFDKDLAKVKMDTIKSADLNALAMWRDSSVKDAYCGVNVEIRKKGQDKWTPYFVEKTADFVAGKEPTDNNFNFENLSYNTHYEVRAQYVKCDNCSDRTENCVYAPYSDIMEFVIDQPIDSAVCGDNLPKLADCGEGSEIPKVVAGDIIIANGTEVVVDSVSYPNASDSSIISGTAHLCMPMIKNIQLKMEFEEIQINCAKELVMGRIKSVWDETTCAMIDLDEAGGQNSTGGKDNPSSDATVEPYDPATASSKPSGTLMVDGNKNVMFRTDKDGEVVTIGKFVSFTSSEYQSTNYLADNTHYVEFYNEDKVNNAFDNDQQGYYRNIKNEYEYFDTPHTNVVLPWLANNPGKQKIIKAREVKKKSTSASFESVLFVIPCESGYIQLETTKDANGNYELNIPGLADVASSTPIYAIARTSDETPYFDAGKMMQANYAERTHKLIIVSLIGDLDASYKTEAEKALNSIYGRVGVSWTVELTKFDNDSIKNEILKDGLSIAADDESCWKKETKEMRAIRKLYSESNEIEDNTAYLFVVNRAQEDKFKDTEGDMPRGQAVGYIFKDKVNDAPKFGRLVAHEIGHGVYKLQHTFDYDGLAEKKAQTDNIMDYNTSKPNDFLAHYQWRVMQDSVMFVWGLFQDDEDGMGMLDRFHWIGYSFFQFNSSEQDKVEAFKELFSGVSNKNKISPEYPKIGAWTYSDWYFIEDANLPNVLNKIAKSKKYEFANYEQRKMYYSENVEIRKKNKDIIFEGRICVLSFVNNPVISNYQIHEVEEFCYNKDKRVKALYYGNSYVMIPFYDGNGDLLCTIQFVPSDKTIDFEKLTMNIVEYLLMNPNALDITKNEAAILAAHVYGDSDLNVVLKKTNWIACNEDDDLVKKCVMNHYNCGFKSKLYKHKSGKKYCYATAGTDIETEVWNHGLIQDGMTDIGQIFGIYLYQYVHSVATAIKLNKFAEKEGFDLCFVGHSLGGGLATCNALATGRQAITFNPAATSNPTKDFFQKENKINETDQLKNEYDEEIRNVKNTIENFQSKIQSYRRNIKSLREQIENCNLSDEKGVDTDIYEYSPYSEETCIAIKKFNTNKIKELEESINKTENSIKLYNEYIKKMEQELENFDMKKISTESLYFVSSGENNVLNYVIKGEAVDVATYVLQGLQIMDLNEDATYRTGIFISIDISDKPEMKQLNMGDKHKIKTFLEYWNLK